MRRPLIAGFPPAFRAPALCLLLALVGTFPLVLSPFSRLIGHEDADVWNHAWGPWWFWTSLKAGTLPFSTDLLAWPDGGVLWYIDPLGALFGMGIVPIFGVVAAYNAAVVFNVVLAAAGARHCLEMSAGSEPCA